jgi:group I intron endonuclease
MVVYVIECIPTGKKYVGKTIQTTHARWREYRTEARIGRKTTPIIQAIREHGPDAFTITELCTADCQKRLAERERMYIRKLGTAYPDGYNVATGGQGGKPKRSSPRDPLPEEHKSKIRQSLIAYHAQAKATMANGGGLNGKR